MVGHLFMQPITVSYFYPNLNHQNTTEIEVELDSNLEKKQVVFTTKVEDLIVSDPAKTFGGEFKNRVSKETKSPLIGKFKEGGGIPDSQEGDDFHVSDLLPYIGSQPYDLPEDIPLGSETVLNTDPVLYASFLNRIADAIHVSWEEYAEDAVKELGKITDGIYITKLLISLDKEGNVLRSKIIHGSGYELLDKSTQQAFWDREPFLNPPPQMFKNEQYVDLKFEFHFEIKKSLFLDIVPFI